MAVNAIQAIREVISAAEQAGWDTTGEREILNQGRDACAAIKVAWSALEAAECWLTAESICTHPGQTKPDEILRVIRAALGSVQGDSPDATDAPIRPRFELAQFVRVKNRPALGGVISGVNYLAATATMVLVSGARYPFEQCDCEWDALHHCWVYDDGESEQATTE